MTNQVYFISKYVYCHVFMDGIPCGAHDGLDHLFCTGELQSRMNNIDGISISDYTLIISRYSSFYYGAAVCSRHRYLLCEGYIPKRRCVFCNTSNTTELIQMSGKASLFVRYVPILGYICKYHRLHYEGMMYMCNMQPKIYPENGGQLKWDYDHKIPTMVGTGAMFVETSAPLAKNPLVNVNDTTDTNKSAVAMRQPKHSGLSFSCNPENETSRSSAPSSDLPNSSAAKNDNKTNKLQLTLSTKQNGLLEQKTHSNQQHRQPDIHVTQETETKKDTRKRSSTRGSSLVRVSPTEPMDVQKSIQIKICASHSTSDECKTINMLDNDTLVMLKDKIIQTFKLDNCSGDFSLSYGTSNAKRICWETLEIEKENQTLAELMSGDDYVVTCVSKNPVHNVYPLSGLQNLGNTCFMNSALQCLNHIQPFFNYFRGEKIKTLLNSKHIGKETKSTLTRLYSELIDSFCSPHDGVIVPVAFHNEFGQLSTRFLNYHQHDSLEFLNFLLEILHEDLMQISQEDHSIVSQLFHGKIQTVVTCRTCTRDLKTDESFNFLPLPIPHQSGNAKSSGTRGYKLDQCFQAFLQEEHIGNHGQWYCEYCDKLTDAKKKLCLLELPPVLIIQLKRFNYNLRSYAKIDTLIEYDLDNLDINEYVVKSRRDTSIRYNLVAVSNHWGDLISGHYVTYAKLPGTQDWYKYNDHRVCEMPKNIHVNNSSAYILVYQQEEKDSTIGTPV